MLAQSPPQSSPAALLAHSSTAGSKEPELQKGLAAKKKKAKEVHVFMNFDQLPFPFLFCFAVTYH